MTISPEQTTTETAPSSYFIRESDRAFTATEHVSGAWNPREQHIAAPMGLLAHLIEQDHAARGGSLVISRVTYDILGVIPLDTCEVDIKVIRPGRTIELIEATLSHGGRAALSARAWLLKETDTRAMAGTAIVPLPKRDTMTSWNYSNDWDGGFVRSFEALKDEGEPGLAQGWLRPKYPILSGETVSDTATFLGLIDTANGLSPRVDPKLAAFPNLDLTVSLFRQPRGSWVGYDTDVTFGSNAVGLTHTFLHDDEGPVGVVTQTLTIRPL